jgi:hypothetical protein
MTKRILFAAAIVGLSGGLAAADSHSEKKKDDTAATVPKCRAVDPKDEKNVFEEAEDKSSVTCTKLLLEKLQTHWCMDAANKGKSFDYMLVPEHTMGTGKFKKQIAASKKTYKCIKIGDTKKKK